KASWHGRDASVVSVRYAAVGHRVGWERLVEDHADRASRASERPHVVRVPGAVGDHRQLVSGDGARRVALAPRLEAGQLEMPDDPTQQLLAGSDALGIGSARRLQ